MSRITKAEKETVLLTTEADDTWTVYTCNAVLQKKLAGFADRYPNLCRLEDKNEDAGSATYEISKSRISIRLIPPYSKERRRAASEFAKA